MAERPVFRSPVTRISARYDDGDLMLIDDSHSTKVVVKAGKATPADRLGVEFGSSTLADGVTISSVRPAEWALFGPAAEVASLMASLGDVGDIVVVDHTHQWSLFHLVGPWSRSVLEKLCNADLTDEMTPDGAAVAAAIARVNCDVVRRDVGGRRSYLIASDRSYGQYLFDALLDAGAEFGISARAAKG